jgi:hypothetical protein
MTSGIARRHRLADIYRRLTTSVEKSHLVSAASGEPDAASQMQPFDGYVEISFFKGHCSWRKLRPIPVTPENTPIGAART